MLREGYIEVKLHSGPAWILSSRLSDLDTRDAMFFDCDGVLVDVRDSYDAAIVETVRLVSERLLGKDLPKDVPSRRNILDLKRSGGFNNDWHVSYALLLGTYAYYSKAPCSPGTANPSSPALNGWQSVDSYMTSLARRADPSGIKSIERILLGDGYGVSLGHAKKILGYPVEASIVGRVFDEIFYGPELFTRKFGVEPEYFIGRGLLELESPVVTKNTLDKLAARIGRERLGIISGRDRASAEITLTGLMTSFVENNLIFLLVDPDHSGKGRVVGPFANKPDPKILFKAARGLRGFRNMIYVGDSAEDLLMVRRANQTIPKFLFIGVYGLTNFKDETCTYFTDNGADSVIASVNDLPTLLETVGGTRQ
jgi:HAD superfamily hydrolase (TIGR01549 family)